MPLGVDGQNFVGGHSQYLAVHAGLVFHFQNTNGAARHDNAWNQGYGGDDQHIHRVTVATDGLGDIAIVGRVVHGRAHEAVHKNRASFFVDFVLNGVGVHRNFDNHIELVGGVFSGGDVIEGHEKIS